MFKKIGNTIKAGINTINAFVKEHRTAVTTCFAMVLVTMTASAVMAITAPASGDFAYDIYDIGINSIMKGPIGFVIGSGCIALGGWSALKQNIPMAVGSALGGAAILKCDTLVTSLGLLM